MRLDARTEHIFNYIVRDFIATAAPVPSVKISKKRDLSISPATIRNIMLELDEGGFLEQPHISAGRVPTDKGYRYFVEHLIGWREPPRKIKDFFLLEQEPLDAFFEEMSRAISQHLHLLSVVASPQHHRFLQSGLAEVLRNPEFCESSVTISFAREIEELENDMEKFRSNATEPEISIKEFGMVRTSFQDNEWGECTMISLGPKRMNYEEARSILRYAKEKLDNTNCHG